jgi:hypothetical protein
MGGTRENFLINKSTTKYCAIEAVAVGKIKEINQNEKKKKKSGKNRKKILSIKFKNFIGQIIMMRYNASINLVK